MKLGLYGGTFDPVHFGHLLLAERCREELGLDEVRFIPAGDPPQVTLDCRHLSFVDYSAIAALKTLRERYARAGKHLRVVHLSERCKQLLKRAGVQHG